MHVAPAIEQIKSRYRSLAPLMDERMRRQWAATEAQTYGWGGVSAVSDATGMSRNTIRKGLAELEVRKRRPKALVETRLRREGGGRKRLTVTDPGLLQALERLVEPMTRGDPMSPLRWTCKSTRASGRGIDAAGASASAHGRWPRCCTSCGYSLQANRKTREGQSHPTATPSSSTSTRRSSAFQQRGQPVISVDTKKKELVGDFKNAGREWQPRGPARGGRVHDFPDKELGKVDPLRRLRPDRQRGLGERGHRPRHGASSPCKRSAAGGRRWVGERYPQASELLITADGGGSNG